MKSKGEAEIMPKAQTRGSPSRVKRLINVALIDPKVTPIRPAAHVIAPKMEDTLGGVGWGGGLDFFLLSGQLGIFLVVGVWLSNWVLSGWMFG